MAPYIRIATAEVYRFGDRTPVNSPEAYLAWVTEQLLEKGDQARPWPCDLEALARIEQGRWIVNCLNCKTLAPMTHPIWKLACCAECGCVMRKVVIPEDFAALEQALLARPQRINQGWLPGETLADLHAQNEAHGVTT